MKYVLISRENIKYEFYCQLCKDNVVIENLFKNSGTLQFENAFFYSNAVIMAIEEENNIVGCIALNTKSETEIYINQISVKNDHKRKGIGSELLNQTIMYANGRDIICHVRGYNIPSQELFKSFGFIKDDERSAEDNYFYRKKTNNLTMRKSL